MYISILLNITFRDAVQLCSSCAVEESCGYCLSTLQCVAGNSDGPDDGSPCPSWIFTNTSCPGIHPSFLNMTALIFDCCLAVPNCADYRDCFGCSSQEQCAWCASDNVCTTISEAFSANCRGLVFEPPCPTDFVTGKIFLNRQYFN